MESELLLPVLRPLLLAQHADLVARVDVAVLVGRWDVGSRLWVRRLARPRCDGIGVSGPDRTVGQWRVVRLYGKSPVLYRYIQGRVLRGPSALTASAQLCFYPREEVEW